MAEPAVISTWSGLIEKHGFPIVAALLLGVVVTWFLKRALTNQEKVIAQLWEVATRQEKMMAVLETVLKRINGGQRQ